VYVVGVDVSSFAIDIVGLPLDGDEPVRVTSIPVKGARALERAQAAPARIPSGSAWDEVVAVAIERPYGPGGDTLFALHLMVGAVIAALPERLLPAELLHPASWRKRAGLHGHASKLDVKRYVRAMHPPAEHWKQDTCDAYCIARALRAMTRGEE
jgi:hypothetical protein